MYINLSSNKIFTFFCFFGAAACMLFLTYSYKEHIPTELKSPEAIAGKLAITSRSLYYTTRFWSLNTQLFASTLFAFNGSRSNQGPTSNVITKSIPVLLYHGIVKKADRFSMTSDTFADQMIALKKAGYHTITINQFNDFVQGKRDLPDKSVLITFDDGRRDSYEGADPILKAVGFNALMFVATADSLHQELPSGSYYMDEGVIRTMLESGRWEIGSHAIQADTDGGEIPVDSKGTLGNFLSNKRYLPDLHRVESDQQYKDRITHELVDSKADLESTFGLDIVAMSYPFSDYGQQTVNNPGATTTIASIVKNTYALAFQQVNIDYDEPTDYISNYPDSDAHHLHRVEVPTNWSGDYLVKFLNNAQDKSLPYSDNFEDDRGWGPTWGMSKAENGTLSVHAQDTTGAFTFLDGSRSWQNYMYTARVNVEKGQYLTLIARYYDRNNYLACVYSKNEVRIEQKVNGSTVVLSRVQNTVDVPWNNATLGVLVDGSFMRCYEGDKVGAYTYSVASTTSSDNGGIGFQIWDEKLNNASVLINSLQVVPVEDSIDLKQKLPSYGLL